MDKITSVRIPQALRDEAELLVESGRYKNISDVLVAGLRRELESHKHAKVEVLGKKIAKKVGKKLLSHYLERRKEKQGREPSRTSKQLMSEFQD